MAINSAQPPNIELCAIEDIGCHLRNLKRWEQYILNQVIQGTSDTIQFVYDSAGHTINQVSQNVSTIVDNLLDPIKTTVGDIIKSIFRLTEQTEADKYEITQYVDGRIGDIEVDIDYIVSMIDQLGGGLELSLQEIEDVILLRLEDVYKRVESGIIGLQHFIKSDHEEIIKKVISVEDNIKQVVVQEADNVISTLTRNISESEYKIITGIDGYNTSMTENINILESRLSTDIENVSERVGELPLEVVRSLEYLWNKIKQWLESQFDLTEEQMLDGLIKQQNVRDRFDSIGIEKAEVPRWLSELL